MFRRSKKSDEVAGTGSAATVGGPVLSGRNWGQVPRIGSRGMHGEGGGRVSYLDIPTEYRGTSRQVCGLWPYVVGAGTPMVGVPLGRNIITGATLCCDPIAWFERANLISNPSMFTLAKPGLGKSTINRRMIVGLDFRGTVSLVPGDTKGEYTALMRALGGQVIQLGRGMGALNPLDLGEMGSAASRLVGSARHSLLQEATGRRSTMVAALIAIVRKSLITGDEEALLGRAIELLDDTDLGRPPILGDLAQLLKDGPEALRRMVLADGNDDKYRLAIEPLLKSLMSLVEGPLANTFNRQTSERLSLDRPVSIDLSSIPASEKTLEGAVLLTCWAEAFASIEAHDRLTAAGLEPRRNFFLVLDELWRILRAGVGLVDRVDELTRLNRQIGIGQSMTTHSTADLLSLPNPEDREKAKGFVERSGMVFLGGLPRAEMDSLNAIVPLSSRERELIVEWSIPPGIDNKTGKEMPPPGRGKFLVKAGANAGIPIQTALTQAEIKLNDTNERWANRIADDDEPAAGLRGMPAAGAKR
ncbi:MULTISPECIES: ATP/GTP-binding protein [Streptomyces]|uniref:ATP/GTP-binding protein n=1 Tax=Streptomyces TaxID=1883 RepID=UPI001F62294D|nr:MULTISPECIES: ATP/GTP-binding protein [Streptomyces]